MYKKCQTEYTVKRQRELEKGLLKLMLCKKYEDMTVSDLCAFLEIPRKAFYRYFNSKEGALVALLDHTIADFSQFSHQNDKHGGTALGDLNLFFLFWYEHKELLDALQRSALSGLLVERAANFAVQERLLPRQLKDLPPEIQVITTSFAVCGLMSMLLQWHHQGFLIPPEQMSQLATTLLTKPLINP